MKKKIKPKELVQFSKHPIEGSLLNFGIGKDSLSKEKEAEKMFRSKKNFFFFLEKYLFIIYYHDSNYEIYGRSGKLHKSI